MDRHASLNRLYRLRWSEIQQAWVPVAETAHGRGKAAAAGVLAVLALLTPLAQAGPAGGQVQTGQGSISTAGNVTTVQQSSPTLTLNWQSFNVGANETVKFVQPGASAIAVNRIADVNGSQILGRLTANGQVWLINPNGVYFGRGAQVDVGSLVASTLDVSNADLGRSTRHFAGEGKGSVLNEGTIRAGEGGYVALLGNRVSNQGVLSVQRGTVGFVPIGERMNLAFSGVLDGLGHVVDGLSIHQPQNDLIYVGLFCVTYGGVVRNVGLTGANVVGDKAPTGSLVGNVATGSSISRVYATGSVSGRYDTGGLFGAQGEQVTEGGVITDVFANVNVSIFNAAGDAAAGGLIGAQIRGDLSNAYATGNVSGRRVVGGLIGYMGARATNVYATGSVFGTVDYAIGGLAGYVATGSQLTNAYATGLVSFGGNVFWEGVGGLYGAGFGTINNSYWDSQTTGQATSRGGTGLTTAQMLTASSFSGWDIATQGGSTSTWRIYEGHTAPLLRTFLTPVTVDNATKVYDATSVFGSTAGYSGVGMGGLNRSFILGTASTSSKNAGFYNNVDISGLYSTQQGYDIRAATPSVTGLITQATVVLESLQDTRVYNGTTTSTLTPAVSNLQGSDTVSGATQAFASKNVLGDLGSTLVVTGYTINDGNGGANYAVITTSAAGTITPAPLSIGAVSESRTYNGTATSAGTPTVNGLQSSDTVTDAIQAYASKNVQGIGASTLNVAGYSINDGNGGANYAVTTTSAAGTITPASLVLAAVSDSRTYNGTTTSTATPTVNGLQGSDNVTGATQTYVSRNVLGDGASTLSVTGYTLNDGNGGANYAVTRQAASGSIAPVPLSIDGAAAANKVYDGTTTASISGAHLTGLLAGDDVSLNGSAMNASFADKNVGAAKPVGVAGYALSGADAGNYSVAQPLGLSADITPATLVYVAAPAGVRLGDALTGLGGTVSGFMPGDTLATATTGSMVWNTNAPSSERPGWFAIDGAGLNAQNYRFEQAPANTTALALGVVSAPQAVLQASAQLQAQAAPRAQLKNNDEERRDMPLRIVDGGVRLPANIVQPR